MDIRIGNKYLVIMGFGGVAACFLDLIIKYLHWPYSQIIVIDRNDKSAVLKTHIMKGLAFHQMNLTPYNMESLVEKYSRPGDLILDLTVNVDTVEFLQICQKKKVHYMNAALEQWNNTHPAGSSAKETLYFRHQELLQAGLDPHGTTALLDSGANPGLVSHFAKEALLTLGLELGRELNGTGFSHLARDLGVQTIHISEWDSQSGNISLSPGEFANTWSVEGLIEEALAPAEMGWGTGEEVLPEDGKIHEKGPQNQIYLTQYGCQTKVQSWVPSGPIEGFVIRHGEAYTLSRFLTLEDAGIVVYRPTVHYAYKLCAAAEASMASWKASGYAVPKKMTILSGELCHGRDELGVLLLGSFGARWFGSLLDVTEVSRLLPGHNATNLQVAAGLLSGMEAIFRDPQQGVLMPEDLDHKRALEIAKPFLGPLIYKNCTWVPPVKPGLTSPWSFQNLRIS